MSSTNKTEHLALNQWVGTDPFRMSDFNADNAKIDAAISELQSGALKIATGSYKGTGTYGQANPNSITFPFQPKLVWIQSTDGRYRALFFYGASGAATSMHVSPYTYTLTCTWSGNTLTWWLGSVPNTSGDSWMQINGKNDNCIWLALG